MGDVAGPYQFTHFAAHQAWYAAVNALFGQFKRFRADYRVIPAATYTTPEIARVGLNRKEAEAQGIPSRRPASSWPSWTEPLPMGSATVLSRY